MKLSLKINFITITIIAFFIIIFNTGFIYIQNIDDNCNIEHLCFNTLIAFPEKLKNTNNLLKNDYEKSKITPYEFLGILNELYNNNYTLINIDEVYKIDNNKIEKKTLKLNNKKPLILSFNNVTYKSNYQNLGDIDKIILDRNNKLATYTTKKSIQDRIQYDNEFIVILENFIKEHPDFSHNNARAIIFFTGENGILGYNTNHKNAQHKFETKRATKVVEKLKSLGYKFGCNGYKFSPSNNLSDMELTKELTLWKQEILPIINSTNLFASYQNNINFNDTQIDILLNNGFNVLFTFDVNSNFKTNNNIITLTRRLINGETLRNNSPELSHLFNCEKIYDHTNRQIPFI